MVAWRVPSANGGRPITGYTASAWTAPKGGSVVTSCTTARLLTCRLTGLTNGSVYYVDVFATNAVGGGAVTRPRVPKAPTILRIAAGLQNGCALGGGGQAYCWGSGGNGQLGNGSTGDSLVPVAVDTSGVLAGKTLAGISAGQSHVCVLDSDGKAYCWGSGGSGQLGNGVSNGLSNSSIPVAVDTSGVLAGKTLTSIAAGEQHTCAVDRDGKAYCWGYGVNGPLGNGGGSNADVPVAVDTSGVLAGKTLTGISAGNTHTCAVDSGGKAYCWGSGASGQLGNGGAGDSLVPVAVATSGVLKGKTLTGIAAGNTHTCAVDTGGKAYCWGFNNTGMLGNGGTGSSDRPVAVESGGVLKGKAIIGIAAGQSHTCAVDSGGKAYCWGYGVNGQLGNGSSEGSYGPVAVRLSGVLAGKALTGIAAGGEYTCAVDGGGKAYCWGYGANGQLGNGGTADSLVPVAVAPPM
jgi:alpha-tubulin suppressor-like RCC1 family protein